MMAGLLVAPQGIGAMLTMPIAGALVDRMPVGRIVPFGFIGILVGMFGLAQSTEPEHVRTGRSSAWLFVMGLGMGATMMPIFTSALKTLKAARRRPWLDAAQRRAAGGQRHRHRGHLGRPDQRA